MIRVMRSLYQNCKLVHGDLSEYNTLYYEGNMHIINVSQSVDIDHPLALDFLREDCKRVSEFFERNGVDCITIRKLFDFIVDSSITDESVGCYLEEVQREILARRALRFSVISVKDVEFAKWLASDTIGLQCLAEHSPTAQKQVAEQPKESDTSDTSTEQTNIFGTEYGTDEDDKAEDKDNYNDSKGAEPYDATNDGTQETLPDKKTARRENKKKVKQEKREARKTKTSKVVRKKKKLAKNIKAR